MKIYYKYIFCIEEKIETRFQFTPLKIYIIIKN
jgi:hypothetical protein